MIEITATSTVTPVHGVSIVIPAYNEENGIALVLEQITEILRTTGLAHEVIVVDDGSTDRTSEILEKRDDIRLLRHTQNQGYGAALKTSIRHARYDLICITDADGTYPNEVIPQLLQRTIEDDLDMLVGARTGNHVKIPWMRKPAKWAIGKLANYVVGERIPDINSGLRVFKRSVALLFFPMLPSGFSFTTTITLGMLINGFRVAYMPIDYHGRIGNSKIRPIHDTLNFVNLISRIGLYFAPLKIFMPFSALLFTLGLAWGIFSHLVLGRLADTSMLVVMMASIQVALLGLVAEVINHRVPNVHRKE